MKPKPHIRLHVRGFVEETGAPVYYARVFKARFDGCASLGSSWLTISARHAVEQGWYRAAVRDPAFFVQQLAR